MLESTERKVWGYTHSAALAVTKLAASTTRPNAHVPRNMMHTWEQINDLS